VFNLKETASTSRTIRQQSLSVFVILAVSLLVSMSASALTLTVSVDTPDPIIPGQSGILVTVVADENILVGSTDIRLNWDLAGIQVDSVSSAVLGSFTANIDNPNRTVTTASASSGGDNIPPGTPLMTFMLTANSTGTYNFFITDADGIAPDDLAGVVPPIPPVSLPYTAVPATLIVTTILPVGMLGPAGVAILLSIVGAVALRSLRVSGEVTHFAREGALVHEL